MNKMRKGRKLSRKTDQRKALLRILTTHLILKERIKTTRAKAKETAIFAEKAITLAKKQSLPSIRSLARLFAPRVAKKLVQDLGKRYAQRSGGYTRIIRLGPRNSDQAEMVLLELVK